MHCVDRVRREHLQHCLSCYALAFIFCNISSFFFNAQYWGLKPVERTISLDTPWLEDSTGRSEISGTYDFGFTGMV